MKVCLFSKVTTNSVAASVVPSLLVVNKENDRTVKNLLSQSRVSHFSNNCPFAAKGPLVQNPKC